MRDNKYNSKPYGKKSYNNRVDIMGDEISKRFKTKCDNCGKTCEVPFKPTNGKPVYCNDCFASMKGTSNSSRSYDRGNSGRSRFDSKQMFEAICDKCGKICEVPFKPTTNKPVYCSDCFEQKETSGRNRESGNSKALEEKLDAMNTKLDKLIEILISREEQK